MKTFKLLLSHSLLGITFALAFADSHAMTWTGTQAITGTGVGGSSLRFGENASGLSADQLARITLNGRPAVINSQGYLTTSSGMVLLIY